MLRRVGLLAAILLLVGCASTKALITGDVMLFGLSQTDGRIIGLDENNDGIDIREGDVISISLSRVFLKKLEQGIFRSREILVMTEVFDQPDEQKVLRRILFQRADQAENAALGIVDVPIYGPIHWVGHPIRVRLIVVELVKNERDRLTQFIRNAATAASGIVPAPGGPAVLAASAVAQYLVSLSRDAYELFIDMTFHPVGTGSGVGPRPDERVLRTPLRTGHYIVVKTEHPQRSGAPWEAKTEHLYDRYFVFDDFTVRRTHYLRGRLQSVVDPTLTKTYRDIVLAELKREPIRIKTLPPRDGLHWIEWDRSDPEFEAKLDKKVRFKSFAINPDMPIPPGEEEMEVKKIVENVSFTLRYDNEAANFYYDEEAREKTYAVLTIGLGGKPVPREVFERISADHSKRIEAALVSSDPTLQENLLKEATNNTLAFVKVQQTLAQTSGDRRSGQHILDLLRGVKDSSMEKGDEKIVVESVNKTLLGMVRSRVRNFSWDVDKVASDLGGLKPDNFRHIGNGRFEFVP